MNQEVRFIRDFEFILRQFGAMDEVVASEVPWFRAALDDNFREGVT